MSRFSEARRERSDVADADIVRRIEALVAEAHRLERHQGGAGLTEQQRRRLNEVQVEIDRSWDLLRQRRARRRVGEDPNRAVERPAQVVEGYSQ
ncbi:MAG: DUF2630 family protein [Acidimicrobiales bacterium]